MRSARDDQQLLVLRVGIGLAHDVVALGLALHHVVIGSLAEVARVGLLAVHHQYGRAYLVDVVEEAGVGKGLCADDAPSVVRVAAALVIAAWGDVVVVVVPDKLRGIVGQGIHHAASHRRGVGQSLPGHGLAGRMSRLLLVLGVEVAIAADARHVVHRRGHRSLDARVGRSRVQGNASPSADADDADALGVHIVLFRQEVDSRHEVLRIDVGRSRTSRLAAALAGV